MTQIHLSLHLLQQNKCSRLSFATVITFSCCKLFWQKSQVNITLYILTVPVQVDLFRPLRIMFAAKRKPAPTPIIKTITYTVNLHFLVWFELQGLCPFVSVEGQHGRWKRKPPPTIRTQLVEAYRKRRCVKRNRLLLLGGFTASPMPIKREPPPQS
jgi:hypothetical protein